MKGIRNTIDRHFYLEESTDKLRLVELLLIVGSLLTVFKLESYHILAFSFFIFSSIPYFIKVQKGLDKNVDDKWFLNNLSWVIAASFSAIVSSVFAINQASNLNDPVDRVVIFIILYIISLIFLFPAIYTALKTK